MTFITIILPVYNDWDSLEILLDQINNKLKSDNVNYKLIVINDGSTIEYGDIFKNKSIFKSIKMINLEKNVGSQSAIASAIRFLKHNNAKPEEKYIFMDSDGEDDPSKIDKVIDLISKKKDINLITLKRSIRKESFLFSILYELHVILTFFCTWKYIRFGNYTFISGSTLEKICDKKDLWLAYSASIIKYLKIDHSIIAKRKSRLKGESKMSYLKLILHALKIHTVLKFNVLMSYSIYLITILWILQFDFFNIIFLTILTIFLLHLITIFLIFKKKTVINFDNCLENIKSVSSIKND